MMPARTTRIAFLRAINVGGANRITMQELIGIAEQAGLEDVRTHGASGNILFRSSSTDPAVKAALEHGLAERSGTPACVIIRSTEEIARVVRENPFPHADPSRTGVLLTDIPLEAKILSAFTIPGKEEVVIGKQEVYVHFPEGMGRSKLKWPPALREGTMRNIATLARLAGSPGE